jgi:hypothetical protein
VSSPPADLAIDDDNLILACRDEEGLPPYVDVRLDTVPATDDDVDYSESPQMLRSVAAWLMAAAAWLEEEQGR